VVHVETRIAPPAPEEELIRMAAQRTLEHESASGDLSVVLADDTQLQDLNRQYLGTDAPTDVLSFPSGDADPETGETYLGDVILSVPRAKAQASAAAHPLEAEVQLLVVHGVLHLLGYDHAEAPQKAAMWAAQAQVLKSLGLGRMEIRE